MDENVSNASLNNTLQRVNGIISHKVVSHQLDFGCQYQSDELTNKNNLPQKLRLQQITDSSKANKDGEIILSKQIFAVRRDTEVNLPVPEDEVSEPRAQDHLATQQIKPSVAFKTAAYSRIKLDAPLEGNSKQSGYETIYIISDRSKASPGSLPSERNDEYEYEINRNQFKEQLRAKNKKLSAKHPQLIIAGSPIIETVLNSQPEEKQYCMVSSRSTNNLEQAYFQEGSVRLKKIGPEHLTDMNYHVRWNWNHFIEFLFYHCIFFFVTGPLTITVLGYRPGVLLLRNMEFYGNTLVFYVQCFIYLTNVYCSIQFFFDQSHQIALAEIVYLWALIFNVCLIISAKYATFSPEMILVFKSYHLEVATKKKLQYMHFHTPQSDEARYIELWAAFKRHEFEAALFYLSFFVTLDPKLEKQINQLNENIKVHHMGKVELFQPDPIIRRKRQQLYGFGVLNRLIDEFEKQSSWKMLLLYAWVLALMMSLIPIAQANRNNKTQIDGYKLFFYIFTVISESYCGFICLIFLIASFRDIRKKKYLLVQCGYILSPSKARLNQKKLIPTLDITDPQSIMVTFYNQIKAWSMLRQICFDYGKQYTIRTQAFYSFIIIYCVATSLSIVLYFFNVFQLDQFTMLYLSLGTAVFVIMLVLLFTEQAALNYFFVEYRNLIEDWLNIIQDVQRMHRYYFDEQVVPNNFLHKKIVEATLEKDGASGEHLKLIKQTLEDAQRHIDYDERNNSFTFYGVILTYDRLWGLFAGIGTLIGFTINYWASNK